MSIGSRLKEERSRLGRTQTEFAELANVRKGTQISWEKDASSPTAQALAAFAEAGADALYILTGHRTTDPDYNEAGADLFRMLAGSETIQQTVDGRIATIRQDLLKPRVQPIGGESQEQAEVRVLKEHADTLQMILSSEKLKLTPDQREEIEQLLDIATNPSALSLYRAGNFTQYRARLRDLREQLITWLEEGSYSPGNAVAHLLSTMAADYGVPIKDLAELVFEMREEFLHRLDEGAFHDRKSSQTN